MMPPRSRVLASMAEVRRRTRSASGSGFGIFKPSSWHSHQRSLRASWSAGRCCWRSWRAHTTRHRSRLPCLDKNGSYSNIHIMRRLQLGRPLAPDELGETIELHRRATHDAVGIHIPLFAAFVSLLTGLHSAYVGLAQLGGSAELLDDAIFAGEPSTSTSTFEATAAWTGLAGPQLLHAVPGAYCPESIAALVLPSAQADAAQVRREFDSLLSEEVVRDQLRDACSRSARHVTESSKIWHFYLALDMAYLKALPSSARTDAVQQAFLARLKVPHQGIDRTFQAFSSFVSARYPAEQYETVMTQANKSYSSAVQILQGLQPYEDAVLGPSGGYYASAGSAWAAYVNSFTEARATASKGRRSQGSTTDAVDYDTALLVLERSLALFGLPLTTVEQELISAPPQASYEHERRRREKQLTDKERSQRAQDDLARRSQAESIWQDLGAFLATAPPSYQTLSLSVWKKATRTVPGSGVLIASQMRCIAGMRHSKSEAEQVFNDAISMRHCAERGTRSLVDLLVGRVDVEREYAALALLEELKANSDASDSNGATNLDMESAHAQLGSSEAHWADVYAILEYALSVLNEHVLEHSQTANGRPRFDTRSNQEHLPDAELTLQRYTDAWAERLGDAGLALVEPMWESALELQGGLHIRVWQESAKFYTRKGDAARARALYKQASQRRFPTRGLGEGTDGTQALLQAKTTLLADWVSFEHLYGSSADIQYAMHRQKTETAKMWESYYGHYNAYQGAAAQTSTEASTSQLQTQVMAVDAGMAGEQAEPTAAASTSTTTQHGKRKALEDDDADDAGSADGHDVADSVGNGKRVRADTDRNDEATAKRDREHSAVVVAGLPSDATEAEIRTLFNRCGPIQAITGPTTLADGTAAALVEFNNRSSVTAALTRQGKSLRPDGSEELTVAVGQDCTLYVTNFPEETTDNEIRARFGSYGPIFAVRWPSKKFALKRRFVYIQFTRPEHAKAALVENGIKLSETTKLLVALSDPDRKKKRTDASANSKELYVTGLPRSATVVDEVRALFAKYGDVEDLRVPPSKGKDGQPVPGQIQGIAFVDMHTDLDAQRAMRELNSTMYRGKVLSVTLAAPRGAGLTKPPPARFERGAGGAEKARSVFIKGLPLDAQDGLIQQVLETALGTPGGGSVKRVEWTPGAEGRGFARVELHDASIAGKLLLLPNVAYDATHRLSISPLGARGGAAEAPAKQISTASPSSNGAHSTSSAPADGASMMLPRAARGGGRGRGRGGIGLARSVVARQPVQGEGSGTGQSESMDVDAPAPHQPGLQGTKKGQNDFRAMLDGR